MALPSNFLEQTAFETRPKIQEGMLVPGINMSKKSIYLNHYKLKMKSSKQL